MSVDIVYFKTEQIPDLEAKLSKYGTLTAAVGQDRRSFLMALSEAVGRSDVIIAVGAIASLAVTLSKGLSMPLVPVNWAALGISGDEDATLPRGALPLIVDGSIYGMIIESGPQCIIAVDNEPSAVEMLSDTYILTYLDAVCSVKPESYAESEPESDAETEPETAPAADGVEDQTDYPDIQPVEHFEEELDFDETADLFADIEQDDFLVIDDRKRVKGWLVALIVVIAVLVLGAVGGYFGYTMWWVPRQYDTVNAETKAKYESGALEIGSIPAEYALRFGTLYAENNDIIGWISADGISVDAPVVTGVNRDDGYYDGRLYDGTANKYGTLHIKYAYDTVTNVNPNLVIYGNNYGDGRAFADLEKLLDGNLAETVILHTDSVFYGEDSWEIFSVMVVNSDGSEYNFADNYAALTAEQRIIRLKSALSYSKVSLRITEADLDEVGLNDTFLTLVTPCSAEKGKSVVVMAKRIKSSDEISVTQSNESDDISSETSDNTASSD